MRENIKSAFWSRLVSRKEASISDKSRVLDKEDLDVKH